MGTICGTHKKIQTGQQILVGNLKQGRTFLRHGHRREVTIRKDLYIYILRFVFFRLTEDALKLST
jgi:hypothetical protein